MNAYAPITMIIRSDPMESHRPAEALRVAIGLSGGEPEKINLVLMDYASILIFADPYDFEDAEAIEQHLEAMNEYGMMFYVEGTYFQNRDETEETDFETQEVTHKDIADLITKSRNVLIF